MPAHPPRDVAAAAADPSEPVGTAAPEPSATPEPSTTLAPPDRAANRHGREEILGRLARSPFVPVWPATVVLFAVSPVIAHGSLSGSSILGMLPFAAVLALAATGQTLVVQQGGLDLSVPGMVSLSAVLVVTYPAGNSGRLPAALGLVLLAAVLTGLVTGTAVTRFGVTPIVATLGVNSLLLGVILQVTKGNISSSATANLSAFALDKTFGIPNTVLVAVAVLAVVTVVIRKTVIGRRFVAIGASPRAARVAAIPVQRYQIGTYVAASVCYAAAGVLLAGFLRSVSLFSGTDYLLPTIAAVVLGGTSLAGGNGSVAATGVGALFLVQLQQVVLGLGAPSSVQYVVQGLAIALGMAVRRIPFRRPRTRHPRSA